MINIRIKKAKSLWISGRDKDNEIQRKAQEIWDSVSNGEIEKAVFSVYYGDVEMQGVLYKGGPLSMVFKQVGNAVDWKTSFDLEDAESLVEVIRHYLNAVQIHVKAAS